MENKEGGGSESSTPKSEERLRDKEATRETRYQEATDKFFTEFEKRLDSDNPMMESEYKKGLKNLMRLRSRRQKKADRRERRNMTTHTS